MDAFSDGPFTGNPAAVCLLERPAGERWMQGLANELGLSETAYVWPDGDELSLRWFTPAAEVDLCGHATLATAHALVEAGRCPSGGRLRFRTRSGVLTALVEEALVTLDFPADTPVPLGTPEGTTPGQVPFGLSERPVGYARGRTDLVVELADADQVAAAAPDLAAVAATPYRGVVLTAAGGPAPAGPAGPGTTRGSAPPDYVLRFFGPAVGVPEDPVTGSAQCLLAPYWAPRLGMARFAVRQLSGRGGALEVTVDGDRVHLSGRAVTVLTGWVRPG